MNKLILKRMLAFFPLNFKEIIISFLLFISGTVSAQSFQIEMLNKVNKFRTQNGKTDYKWSNELEKAAMAHSKDQAAIDKMTHTGSDGSDFAARIKRTKFVYSGTGGENVAYTFDTSIDGALDMWMNSTGHRQNILSSTFTHIGAAIAQSKVSKKYYWTQVFAKGSDPVTAINNLQNSSSLNKNMSLTPDKIILRFTSPVKNLNVQIYDLNGNILYCNKFNSHQSLLTLNTSFLPPGVFSVNINSDYLKSRIKYIKVKD